MKMSARPVVKTSHMNAAMQEFAIMAAQVRNSSCLQQDNSWCWSYSKFHINRMPLPTSPPRTRSQHPLSKNLSSSILPRKRNHCSFCAIIANSDISDFPFPFSLLLGGTALLAATSAALSPMRLPSLFTSTSVTRAYVYLPLHKWSSNFESRTELSIKLRRLLYIVVLYYKRNQSFY